MLVRVSFYGAALFSSVVWGSSDKPKKTCLANPRRDLEIKFPGKRSYKHWGNVYPTKSWFKIFKICIIYDLLVYMGSKKAYAGINLGESGSSWNYAREIWSNTNYVKKPTKNTKQSIVSSVSTFSPLPDGFTMFYLFQNGLQEKHLQCLQCKEIPATLHGTFSLKRMFSPRLGWILYERPRFSGSKDAQNILVSYIDIPLRIPLNDSGFGGTRLWRRCLLGSDARHWRGNSILPTCGRNNPRASDDIYPLFSTGQFAGAQNYRPPGNPPLGTLRWRFLILSYLFGALAILTM